MKPISIPLLSNCMAPEPILGEPPRGIGYIGERLISFCKFMTSFPPNEISYVSSSSSLADDFSDDPLALGLLDDPTA